MTQTKTHKENMNDIVYLEGRKIENHLKEEGYTSSIFIHGKEDNNSTKVDMYVGNCCDFTDKQREQLDSLINSNNSLGQCKEVLSSLRESYQRIAQKKMKSIMELYEGLARLNCEIRQTDAMDDFITKSQVKTEHTSNKWEWKKATYNPSAIDMAYKSNSLYQFMYRISENKSYRTDEVYSYSLSWNMYLLHPNVQDMSFDRGMEKIGGQEKKFDDIQALNKYLNGRIKAYSKCFTEENPPVPQEFQKFFTMNGKLLLNRKYIQ